MTKPALYFTLILTALFTTACAEDDPVTDNDAPDTGIVDEADADGDTNGDERDIGVAQDAHTDDAGPDTDTNDEDPEDCVLELELDDGLIIADTREDPLDADSFPLICWHVPDGKTLPDADDGWKVRVEREENAGGEQVEWRTVGLDVALREITYGDCSVDADECTDAADLYPGSYFVHVLDPGNPAGLAGSLVFDVE
jgi:hypothetical protein